MMVVYSYALTKTLWFSPFCTVDMGELLELYHAIMWINDLQSANIDFEVDQKKIVDYLREITQIFWGLGTIMGELLRYICKLRCTDIPTSKFFKLTIILWNKDLFVDIYILENIIL